MTKIVSLVLFALSAAVLLDIVAYIFFGQSLAYCPAEGSCGEWIVLRLFSGVVLAGIGSYLRTYYP